MTHRPFRPRARRAMELAHEEARALGHGYLGTEHVLLGLLREGDGVAARVLAGFGVELEETRREVVRIVGRGEAPPPGEPELTSRTQVVLERALEAAQTLRDREIDTEHLLLALAHEDGGVAAHVLDEHLAQTDDVADAVLAALGR